MPRAPVYSLLRPLLFLPAAETSHRIALRALRLASASDPLCAALQRRYGARARALPVRVMGLDFPNPVGLAAGLDKDALAVDGFAALGFGFVEVGTVTPRPQPGNPRPRLFRLPAAQGIINRMGFNSAGMEALLAALRRRHGKVVLGINLGKNADTPMAAATDDYLEGLEQVYGAADYAVINISSPNTRDLRTLESGEALSGLLRALADKRAQLQRRHGHALPLALKISPDLNEAQLEQLCDALLQYPVDALIATNTTLSRDGCDGQRHAAQSGGLSGAPLRARATAVIRRCHRQLRGRLPIIGVGGIGGADDAWEKLCAGADLVQIYSALVYHGPGLALRIINGLHSRVTALGHTTLAAALAEARSASIRQPPSQA